MKKDNGVMDSSQVHYIILLYCSGFLIFVCKCTNFYKTSIIL